MQRKRWTANALAAETGIDRRTVADRLIDVKPCEVKKDRNGKETPALEQSGNYREAALSPDGRHLAFDFSKGYLKFFIPSNKINRSVYKLTYLLMKFKVSVM